MLVNPSGKLYTTLNSLATHPELVGVSAGLIERALRSVPAQQETWSCGAYSAAYFAIMHRQSPLNFIKFLHTLPTYAEWARCLGVPRVGPNGGRLLGHVRGIMQGSDVGFRGGDSWGDQEFIIRRALNMGRPALVLLSWSNTAQHWINIIGFEPTSGRYVLLDTDRRLYTLPAAQLEREMYAGGTASRKFNFISNYNSITCTLACNVRDMEASSPWMPISDHHPPFPSRVERERFLATIHWAVMRLEECNPHMGNGQRITPTILHPMQEAIPLTQGPISANGEVIKALSFALVGALYTSADVDLNGTTVDWQAASANLTRSLQLLDQYRDRTTRSYDEALVAQIWVMREHCNRSQDVGPIEAMIIRLQACASAVV